MESRKLASTILSVSCRTLIFVIVAMGLYFVGRTAFSFGKDIFDEKSMTSKLDAREVEITIPDGYTTEGVAELLKAAGLIEDARLFRAQTMLSDYYMKFTPGTYRLNTGMTPSEILAAISVVPETATGG
ncbi:MAG: endolytic transglycosylase MltG [Butyrivibrio sp.]|nr:endolytic transglycosylase MltG [Butyrivibrio sp.]